MKAIAWLLALSISLTGLTGWLTGKLGLTRISDEWVTMKFTTAILCLLACGMVFHLHVRSFRHHVVGTAMAMVILIFAGVLVIDIRADGWSSGFSTIGASKDDGAVMTTQPGMPSLGTMVAFTLIGSGGLFYALGAIIISKLYGFIAAVMGGIALVGYLVNRPALYFYQPDESTAMAITTATVVTIVGALLYHLGEARDHLVKT